MRKLPEEDDQKKDDGFRLNVSADGSPSKQRGHGSGEGANESRDWRNLFERRIKAEISYGRCQGKRSGEHVGG